MAGEELRHYFGKCKASGDVRLIKVVIKDETLELSQSFRADKNWETDYSRVCKECFDERQPCYVLLQLDSRSESLKGEYEWLFITFVPDNAPIREKMLYASTQMTLKTQFGNGCVKYDLHASTTAEASVSAIKRYIAQKSAHIDRLDAAGDHWPAADIGSGKRKSLNSIDLSPKHGVDFPVDGAALDALRRLKGGAANYVQLAVDTLNEAIKLEKCGVVSLVDLNNDVARVKPRYHFYTFSHVRDGQQRSPVVFIYSLPTLNTPIKEKMLYSSCKEPFLATVKDAVGLTVDKKIELDDKEIISYDFLLSELYPIVHMATTGLKFDKPKAPSHRRLQRHQNS